ncbi:cAMP-binding proteins - catabolite gene activator and regulatory subunit of cAMP-dependent protein kinases [hydrothermal vent metagenome]|uniref:cAMP-binding proteins - catabolite gene activator and regulatory subunit of cAMP-dependent protein kinases n=1 Tax=hydrothermal vent metagenome TaxID=652676 RepID=A0A3B0V8D2_9ZZZZ
MYSDLKQFVSQFAHLSQEEWEAVMPFIETRNLKKNEYFVREGEIARYISFTQNGYLRVYYNHDGDEITRDISPLHSFVTALPSYISQTPSYEIIQAITDCELFVIYHDNLEFLYDSYSNWQRVGRRVIEEMFVQTQSRIYAFITQPADVRYKEMMKQFPDIFQHVPLQYIASYLGITSQSLSRLRRSVQFDE